jgi:hypothetical protein
MSRACRRILVAACSSALLLSQAAPAWAQASHWEGPGGGAPSLNYQGPQGPYPGVAAARQQMSARAGLVLAQYRLALQREEEAREAMRAEGCNLRANSGARDCREMIARVNGFATWRRRLEAQIDAAGGVQRVRAAALAAPTARREAIQASPGGIDPATAAVLGAVAGGLIGFGVTRGARGNVPQMGRSNRPMPVGPHRRH